MTKKKQQHSDEALYRGTEVRIPLSEDERKTLLWAGWKPSKEAAKESAGSYEVPDDQPLPTYEAPPATDADPSE